MPHTLRPGALFGATVLLFALITYLGLVHDLLSLRTSHQTASEYLRPFNASTRPPHLSVVGLVHFRRPEAFSVLDCYLKRSLYKRGGWLDQVQIYADPSVTSKHLSWLDEHVGLEKTYLRPERREDLTSVWDLATDSDIIYVKFDDDLVWMADHAVQSLVESLLDHPDAFLVAGNIVNRAFSLGPQDDVPLRNYLPEMGPPGQRNFFTWRTSQLPAWQASPRLVDELPVENLLLNTRYRWLPLVGDQDLSESLELIRNSSKEAMQLSVSRQAQEHYTFLHHLESRTTRVYGADGGEPVDTHLREPIDVGLVALHGRDLRDRRVDGDAEQQLTIDYPREAKKSILVRTDALAVRYSYHPDAKEVRKTDLIDRYRTVANEFVCEAFDLSIAEWTWDPMFEEG